MYKIFTKHFDYVVGFRSCFAMEENEWSIVCHGQIVLYTTDGG